MGKGDKKSKRGKIVTGSYGVRRRSKSADKGLKVRLGVPIIESVKKVKAKADTDKKTTVPKKKTAVENKTTDTEKKKTAAPKKAKSAEKEN